MFLTFLITVTDRARFSPLFPSRTSLELMFARAVFFAKNAAGPGLWLQGKTFCPPSRIIPEQESCFTHCDREIMHHPKRRHL
jgi:hypothetical protein